MTSNKCPWCDKTFELTKYLKIFCSIKCSATYNNKFLKKINRLPRNCLICDQEFTPKSKYEDECKIYCSKYCYQESRRRELTPAAKYILKEYKGKGWVKGSTIRIDASLKHNAYKVLLYVELIEAKRSPAGKILEIRVL